MDKLAPNHLSDNMKSWWRQINDTFELESQHLKILTLACEAFDQAEIARAHLAIHGNVYVDRWGQPKQRPEIQIQQQARRDFARLLRELGLDSSGPELPRHPGLKR